MNLRKRGDGPLAAFTARRYGTAFIRTEQPEVTKVWQCRVEPARYKNSGVLVQIRPSQSSGVREPEVVR